MSVFCVKVDLYIDGGANNDTWAKGLVENVVDYTKALGGQAAVVVGTAGERNSYAVSGVVDTTTQEFTVQKAWHVDASDAVVDGLPSGAGAPPPAEPTTPAWEPWPGSGPTYQIGEQVSWNKQVWESTVANNVWEPGVYGWVVV